MTTPTDPAHEHDEALVEQRHRDLAADAVARLTSYSGSGIRDGECDDHHMVQAFARFEQSIRTTDAERIKALEGALRSAESAISEYYRYWTGGETRGSYDGKPERAQLWKVGECARTTLAGSKTDGERIKALEDLLCLADELLMQARGAYPLPGNPNRELMAPIRAIIGKDFHQRKERAARAAITTAPVGWLPIESVPSNSVWVLCWGADCLYGIAKFGPNPIMAEYPEYSHWMPLPAPPRTTLAGSKTDDQG